MRKIFPIIIISLIIIATMTSSVAADTLEPTEIKINIIDNYVIADVYVNLDEEIEACGVAYSFDENILTLNQQQSGWTEEGMLSSLIDIYGDYCAVWAVPRYEGINFNEQNRSILHLVFNIKEDFLYEDVTFKFDVRLINDSIDITTSSSVIVQKNATYEISLFAQRDVIELYPSVEKCFFVNDDYHILIIDDVAYIRPHTRDMYDVCVFCHKYISDTEVIMINEPVEAALEEVE